MAILELNHVSRVFGNFTALSDVNLRLEPGMIGLLGPNGAGKSTLLKILMGLLTPSEGSGSVFQYELQTGGEGRRRLMGYMSEADALIPGLRGAEYVALAGELYGMPKRHAQRRAHELLTYLDLDDARYRRLEEYSTGMKQRLKLAQAIVHDPPLLLLDEPTSGLDPAGREAMLKLLVALGRDQNKSLILSTHLLGDVERVCNHVVILFGGKVLKSGSMEELRSYRFDRYILHLEGEIEPFLDDLRVEGVQVTGQNGTQDIRVAVPQGWMTRLFFTLADNRDVTIRGLQRDDEHLEEVFQRTMEGERQEGSRREEQVRSQNAGVRSQESETGRH